MSFKGTAGKSSSGASMSKYDVEVEARLQKLEQAVSSISNIEAMVSALEGAVDRCKTECAANAKSSGGTVSVSGLKEATKGLGPEAKINAIIAALS